MTKRKGAIIPDPIDTPGTRKIVVCIPDTVEWLSLFTGLVSQLRYGWYWDRQTGDLDAIRDRAKRVYFEMQDQDGDCMDLDCDQVAECIENNENVRRAIAALINAGTVPGDKMSSSRRNADLASGTNPECDLDILWAQSLAIVKRMNDFLVYFTSEVETKTNTTEIGTFIASLPGIENLGISSITGLADTLFAALPENYIADYGAADPETGIFWYETLACDIFCNAELDCELSIEDIWQVLQSRMEAVLSGLADDWTDLLSWVTDFADLDITLVNMADFFFYLAFSGLRLGGLLLVTPATGDKVLQIAAALAADQPSNDWVTLCDCAEAWCFLEDLTTTNGGYAALPGELGEYTSSVGWEDELNLAASIRELYIGKDFPDPVALTHVDITLTAIAPSVGGQTQRPIGISGYLAGILKFSKSVDPMTAYYGTDTVFSWDAMADDSVSSVGCDELRIFMTPGNLAGSGTDPTGSATLTAVAVSGLGYNPYGASNC